jgi:hypothetical protein
MASAQGGLFLRETGDRGGRVSTAVNVPQGPSVAVGARRNIKHGIAGHASARVYRSLRADPVNHSTILMLRSVTVPRVRTYQEWSNTKRVLCCCDAFLCLLTAIYLGLFG